jgi:hypothetical protein
VSQAAKALKSLTGAAVPEADHDREVVQVSQG